jgi:hypothetical protein
MNFSQACACEILACATAFVEVICLDEIRNSQNMQAFDTFLKAGTPRYAAPNRRGTAGIAHFADQSKQQSRFYRGHGP